MKKGLVIFRQNQMGAATGLRKGKGRAWPRKIYVVNNIVFITTPVPLLASLLALEGLGFHVADCPNTLLGPVLTRSPLCSQMTTGSFSFLYSKSASSVT